MKDISELEKMELPKPPPIVNEHPSSFGYSASEEALAVLLGVDLYADNSGGVGDSAGDAPDYDGQPVKSALITAAEELREKLKKEGIV